MWLRCLDGSPGIHGNTDRTGCKEQEINTFFFALSSKSRVIVTFQHWDDSLKCFTESKHLEQQTCPPPRVGALHLKGSQAKENLELHYIILIELSDSGRRWIYSPWSSTSWWQRRESSGCCGGLRPGKSRLLKPAPLRCRSGRDSRGSSKLKRANIVVDVF